MGLRQVKCIYAIDKIAVSDREESFTPQGALVWMLIGVRWVVLTIAQLSLFFFMPLHTTSMTLFDR
jgi:hypothetical protein